jgi:hypothetical protein
MNPAIFAALAIVAGMFLGNAIGYGLDDGDLFWQRQLGEVILRAHALPATLGRATFTAPDAHWIPHEWLFATAWAAANRFGAPFAFRAACAGIGLLTVVVAALRSRAADSRARMIMLVVVGVSLVPSFGLRAQILGWPLLALIMLALEAGPRRAWLAVPLTVLWSNLHASAVIVPCIVAVYAVGIALERRALRPALPYAVLAGATALATLATPFGIELPRFALNWSSNPATSLIQEWLPAAPDKILIVGGVLVAALLLVLGEVRGARMSWPRRLLAAGLFAAAMLHIRNLGPFIIVAGPWVADALAPRSVRRYTWRNDAGLALCGLVCAALLVVECARLPMSDGASAPAVAQVAALPGPLRVACEDFSWCSRFAADSNVRVFIDGRTDAYPPAVFSEYRRILAGEPLPVFARWHVDVAIVKGPGPVARALRAGGWRLLRSGDPQVYLRPALGIRQQSELVRFGRIPARQIERTAFDQHAAQAP